MAAQQGQQQSDNSLALLWGIGLCFAAAWLLWYFFHNQIAGFVLKLKIYEAYLVAGFASSAQGLVLRLQALSPAHLQASDLVNISMAVGHYLRYPVMAIMLIFALLIYNGRATLRFKKHYSMNTLVEAEKANWVQVTPVVRLDLVQTDIDTGPWAMALTPMQFAKQHRLIRLEQVMPTVATATTAASTHHLLVNLQREPARRAFVTQLGAYWQGVEYLPAPTRALFAVFAARAARDREAATRLLLQISDSAAGNQTEVGAAFAKRLNFTGVDELLKKHKHHPGVIQVTRHHAYILTVMASMLQLARQDGVLASAEFLWLKPADRALWFMLNSVGRQAAFPEAAGPFAHWIAEQAIGYRLLVPMVDAAINALEMALKEVRVSGEGLEEPA